MQLLKKLTLGDRVVGGAGVVLLVDLLFLPWHHVEVGFGTFTASADRTAIESPDAAIGWLAVLLTAAMVAHIVLVRFTDVQLPELGLPWSQISMIGGFATLAALLLKLLAETDYLGYGAWVGLALGAAMAYGGFLHEHEHFGLPAAPGA